jgi:glutathione S-transferase
MKLYGFPASPNTWKVRAVAAHLGLPVALEFVDLTKGAHRTPDFLALNPTGRTPVLVDGDFALWESTAIMQYLAASSPLWPDDARARATIMQWQSFDLQHWGKDACQPLVFERLVKKIMNIGTPDPANVAKGTDAFNREASVLDAHLTKHSYLAGDTITLADFSVASGLLYAKEAELPLASYPHLGAWAGRILGLPAWRDTAPDFAAAA